MKSPLFTLLPKAARLAADGIERGWHPGVQVYASRGGQTLVDAALGEARPGVPMRPETLNLWLSATKPVGAVALALLRERGRVDFDRPVAGYLPEFAAGGKEAITLRHLLTHSGGFRAAPGLRPGHSWAEAIEKICAARLEPRWIPGQTTGYHPETSWYILGEVVRRVDGRPFCRFVRDEVFKPLGMLDCWVGLPRDYDDRYGERIAWHYTTHGADAPAANGWERAPLATQCVPGVNGRGPARQLARLYEMLLGGGEREGVRILGRESVDLLTQPRRRGVEDRTFRHRMNWGLGLIVDSKEYGARTMPYGFGLHSSAETFGHGGRESSVAFADPARGLAMAVIFNGQPGEARHQARMRDFVTAAYEDLGCADAHIC